MLEFRIGRLVTRWHLGERLAKVERAQGHRNDIVGSPTKSLRAILERIKVDIHDGHDAQRIACLPPPELEVL